MLHARSLIHEPYFLYTALSEGRARKMLQMVVPGSIWKYFHPIDIRNPEKCSVLIVENGRGGRQIYRIYTTKFYTSFREAVEQEGFENLIPTAKTAKDVRHFYSRSCAETYPGMLGKVLIIDLDQRV